MKSLYEERNAGLKPFVVRAREDGCGLCVRAPCASRDASEAGGRRRKKAPPHRDPYLVFLNLWRPHHRRLFARVPVNCELMSVSYRSLCCVRLFYCGLSSAAIRLDSLSVRGYSPLRDGSLLFFADIARWAAGRRRLGKRWSAGSAFLSSAP